MKKKILIAASLILLIFVFGVYWAFFDMNRLPEGVLISEALSPDGTYTVKAYHVSGSATVSDSVRGELVFNNMIRKPKNIYWNYREDTAEIIWIDEDTVTINGISLDVPEDRFDFRNQ
jgi:outer membrane lipoprotein-sorting protein